RAEQALRGGPAAPPPGRPADGRRGQHGEPPLDLEPGERGVDLPPAAHTRRRESDELLTADRSEPEQRPADVVPHSRPRMGKRRDVDDDSHAPGAGSYWKPVASTPRFRGSGLFSAG